MGNRWVAVLDMKWLDYGMLKTILIFLVLAKLGLLHLGCNRDAWGHNYHFARLRIPCNVQQVRH